MAVIKTGLTAAALGVTAWSRVLGKRISAETRPAVEDGTSPTPGAPDVVAGAQKQIAVLQWVVPALTGILVIPSAFAGEQQRPTSVLAGVRNKLIG